MRYENLIPMLLLNAPTEFTFFSSFFLSIFQHNNKNFSSSSPQEISISIAHQ